MGEVIQTSEKKVIVWSAKVEREMGLEYNKINKMTKLELRDVAKDYKLNMKGSIKVLRSRLKAFIRKEKQISLKLPTQISSEHKYLVIIDFEATCNEDSSIEKPEIIEFPAVLYDTEERKVITEFKSYVKPVLNETLTTFCQNLTGISQKNVNDAPLFCDVLTDFQKWLQTNGMDPDDPNFTIVTDGSSDIGSYLRGQCEISGIEMPKWGNRWINIKKTYSNFYQCYRLSIMDMLSYAALKFQGQLHRGIDDARNIGQIVHLLLEDGAPLLANECLIQDPTNPLGYTLANITKQDNFTTVEIRVTQKAAPKKKSFYENIFQKKGNNTIKQETFTLDNNDFPALS